MKANGVLKICVKCCDRFSSTYERKGELPIEYEGYVPGFFPNEHYGDYVELDIDVATGRITNWVVPTEKELLKQIKNNNQ